MVILRIIEARRLTAMVFFALFAGISVHLYQRKQQRRLATASRCLKISIQILV